MVTNDCQEPSADCGAHIQLAGRVERRIADWILHFSLGLALAGRNCLQLAKRPLAFESDLQRDGRELGCKGKGSGRDQSTRVWSLPETCVVACSSLKAANSIVPISSRPSAALAVAAVLWRLQACGGTRLAFQREKHSHQLAIMHRLMHRQYAMQPQPMRCGAHLLHQLGAGGDGDRDLPVLRD